MKSSKNNYDILGVSNKSTEADIRQAYLNLVKKHHPDCKTGNAEKFKELNEAYEILSDKSMKSKYDSEMFKGSKDPSSSSSGSSKTYNRNAYDAWESKKERAQDY